MNKVTDNELIKIIKEDNLVLFSAHIEDRKNLSFGRFPLLTIAYMYNAHKIISKYGNELGLIKKYKIISEPYELYKKFKSIAGKLTRLYIGFEEVISPLEILAMMGKDGVVKKLYKSYYVDDTIKDRIREIYRLCNLNIYIDSNGINIPARPMKEGEKRVYQKAIILSSAFSLLLAIVFIFAGIFGGFGFSNSPYKIFNERQLLKALASGGNYSLTRDLHLEDGEGIKTFDGSINGNGYSIYIDYSPSSALLLTNNGNIKNINIIYGDLAITTNTMVSLFVDENKGEIDGVNIVCGSLEVNANKNADNDVGLVGFAINNTGTIKNSSIKINCLSSATADGESYVSGYVSNNTGSILNSQILGGSSLSGVNCDIVGFAMENTKDGVIYNCKNYANLSQSSSLNGWSPTISGISLSNYGTIENCINSGNISNVSTNDGTDGVMLTAGIVAYNYGSVVKSMNTGDIQSISENIMVYTGGVCAYSGYYIEDNKTVISYIINCGAKGNIEVSSTADTAYIFAGGISGYLYGEISECFSLSSFTNGYLDGKYFIGTALGSATLEYQLFTSVICIIAEENYVLNLDNVDYQIGALITSGSILKDSHFNASDGEIVSLMYDYQIVAKEVYWSE